MMTDLKERITKARNKKALNQIVEQALTVYGFFSKEYGEILTLCWNRLDEIN